MQPLEESQPDQTTASNPDQFHKLNFTNAPTTNIRIKVADLPDVLAKLSKRKLWQVIEQVLSAFAQDERYRGAELIKALNIKAASDNHNFLTRLIRYGAPLKLFRTGMELGASSRSMHLVTDRTQGKIEIPLLHLSLAAGRFDVAQELVCNGYPITVKNSIEESAIRFFVRVAGQQVLEKLDVSQALGTFVRRQIESGESYHEVESIINTLVKRKLWQITELVLDQYSLAENLAKQTLIPKRSIGGWALVAINCKAPKSLIKSLVELDKSGNIYGSFGDLSSNQKELLIQSLPAKELPERRQETAWKRYETLLDLIGEAAPIFDKQHIDTLINVQDEDAAKLENQIIDPVDLILHDVQLIKNPTIEGLPSLLHILIERHAPIGIIDKLVKLDVNLEQQSYMMIDPPTVRINGTPLHLAIQHELFEHAEVLLDAGASVSTTNRDSISCIKSYFLSKDKSFNLKDLPLLSKFIAAYKSENNNQLPIDLLEDSLVQVFPLDQIIELAYDFDPEVTYEVPTSDTAQQSFTVEAYGSLQEVDEEELKLLLFNELRKHIFHQFASTQQLEKHLLEEPSITRSPETSIILSMQTPGVLPIVKYFFNALSSKDLENYEDQDNDNVSQNRSDVSFEEREGFFNDLNTAAIMDDEQDDLSSDNEYLSFPEFSNEDIGLDYEDDLEEDYTETDEDIVEQPEIYDFSQSIPENDTELSETSETQTPDKSDTQDDDDDYVDISISLLDKLDKDDAYELRSLPEEPKDIPASTEITTDFTTSTELTEMAYTHDSTQSFHHILRILVRSKRYYEAYLLTRSFVEVTSRKETELSATSRSLKTFLFQLPIGASSAIGMRLDHSPGMSNNEGSHPYMAEYACLLRHPQLTPENIRTLSGLTLGISSVARLVDFGNFTGKFVDALGRLGTYNFSFPLWRWYAQPVKLSQDQKKHSPSLLEYAGLQKVKNPIDEWQTDKHSGERVHRLGALFYMGSDTEFFKHFDHETSIRLGYDPLLPETKIILRRACCIIYHPSYGILVFRNSSHAFGRDRLPHFAAWASTKLNKQQLLNLSQETITKAFSSVVGKEYFKQLNMTVNPFRMDRLDYAKPLQKLLGQCDSFRAQLDRWTFDTNLNTAWSPDGSKLLGGYKSPLFPHIVDLLDNRLAIQESDSTSKILVPSLNVSNPDFIPAPHASVKTTGMAVDILKKLVQGEENSIDSGSLQQSGLQEFFEKAFNRGKNSELILLPPT